ncbi:MAG: fasciclin domain-containing protein [Ignavibacteriaceae bacterium]
MKRLFLLFLSVSVLSIAFIGCSDSATTNPVSSENAGLLEKRPGNGQTIVQIASGNPDFAYLVAAVQFAGLADVLNGNRQFTVFAPVNSAFEDLAAALNLQSVNDLLTEQYRELVTNVLLYHVSPGLKFSQNVVKSGRVNTLLEQFAFSKVENETAKIGNDATGYADIIDVDLRASNGVIHVINKVIIPVLD